MKTLLEKLEKIRKELGTDKVFDVIGRLFEGVSLRDYLECDTATTLSRLRFASAVSKGSIWNRPSAGDADSG